MGEEFFFTLTLCNKFGNMISTRVFVLNFNRIVFSKIRLALPGSKEKYAIAG